MTNLLVLFCLLQSPLESRIDELLPRMGAESLEERTSAAAALKELARSDPRASRPLLRKRLQSATDDQVKAGLRSALDALPKVELRIAVKEPLRVEETASVQAIVRNLTEAEIVVPLPTFEAEMGIRFPKVTASVLDPDGNEFMELVKCWRGMIRPPVPEEFIKLAPGAEVDLLATDLVRMRNLKAWRPEKAGMWKLKLAFDWTPTDPSSWIPADGMTGSLDPRVPDLLAAIPREKLEASLEVRVAEK